jgi:predicted DNA-binding transcriptional regulator AlpA
MTVNTTDAPRFARKSAVCRILGCGSTYIYYLVQQGELTPIRLSRRMTVYDLAEVNALADKRIAAARKAA